MAMPRGRSQGNETLAVAALLFYLLSVSAVCCEGVKLGKGVRRDSYLFLRILGTSWEFLRIPKICLRMHEDTQKAENKCSTRIFVPGLRRGQISRQIDNLSI